VIVVDTNVIVHLLVEAEHTQRATQAFARDPEWTAPRLWRSEFRSVLSVFIRKGRLSLVDALKIAQKAELMMRGREYEPASVDVLGLAAKSGCSAYDCEFVAVARDLGLQLVTLDRAVLSAFPGTAVSLEEFTS
jgi:predicted nucleic acid-binding protein